MLYENGLLLVSPIHCYHDREQARNLHGWTGTLRGGSQACLGVCLHGIGDAGDDDSSACPVREVQPLTHLASAPSMKPSLMHPCHRCHECSQSCSTISRYLEHNKSMAISYAALSADSTFLLMCRLQHGQLIHCSTLVYVMGFAVRTLICVKSAQQQRCTDG